jgi:hypothetical protein
MAYFVWSLFLMLTVLKDTTNMVFWSDIACWSLWQSVFSIYDMQDGTILQEVQKVLSTLKMYNGATSTTRLFQLSRKETNWIYLWYRHTRRGPIISAYHQYCPWWCPQLKYGMRPRFKENVGTPSPFNRNSTNSHRSLGLLSLTW